MFPRFLLSVYRTSAVKNRSSAENMKNVSSGLWTAQLFGENYKSILSLEGTHEKIEHWQLE